MTQGSNDLHFFYDAQDKPAMVRFNGTDYFYVYNLQGDVVAMIDANGTQVVEYYYDAWGAPISRTGTMAATLGTLNLFRYRGYVYDEETGLYYLKDRYYNPLWKRFISADEKSKTGNQLLGAKYAAEHIRTNRDIYYYNNEMQVTEWMNSYYATIEIIKNIQNGNVKAILEDAKSKEHQSIETCKKYFRKHFDEST